MDIYEDYKPLRNFLKPFNPADSFYVIWAYNQNIAYNTPFPKDITPIPNFPQQDYIQKVRLVAPWQLEILTKETIINADPLQFPKKTLRDPKHFFAALEKLHNIEGAISKKYINKDNVLKEMQRLSHRQFPWQNQNPSISTFARYYKVFSSEAMNEIVQQTIGISVNDLCFFGLQLWGLYLKYPAVDLPIKNEVTEITTELVKNFLSFFSKSVEDIKPILKSEQQLNEKYQYAYNSLKRYQLLDAQNGPKRSLYCPLPDLFFSQMLKGVYYGIHNEKGFDKAFGDSFQSYIGEVVKKAEIEEKISIYAEESYNASQERTADWILEDAEAFLFIECKTKRLTFAAKEELLIDEQMNVQLDKMANAILQVYKTIKDYKEGLYLSLKPKVNKTVFPLIITLEDWYFFGEGLSLKNKISELLIKESLPLNYLEEMPYSICSTQEFESIVQVLQNVPIKEFILGKLSDKEMSTWVYASYIKKQYSEIKIKDLFPDELDKILPDRFKSKV